MRVEGECCTKPTRRRRGGRGGRGGEGGGREGGTQGNRWVRRATCCLSTRTRVPCEAASVPGAHGGTLLPAPARSHTLPHAHDRTDAHALPCASFLRTIARVRSRCTRTPARPPPALRPHPHAHVRSRGCSRSAWRRWACPSRWWGTGRSGSAPRCAPARVQGQLPRAPLPSSLCAHLSFEVPPYPSRALNPLPLCN